MTSSPVTSDWLHFPVFHFPFLTSVSHSLIQIIQITPIASLDYSDILIYIPWVVFWELY